MIRNPLLVRLLRNVTFLSAFLAMFGQIGQADDALSFANNWFVTGDVTFASVALRSSGNPNGLATGTITVTGVPCSDGNPVHNDGTCDTLGAVPADIVAALLYWQTEETTPTPAAMNGYFD